MSRFRRTLGCSIGAVVLWSVLAPSSAAAIMVPEHKTAAIHYRTAARTQLTHLETCNADATSALSTFINGAPDATSITLPARACFLVNGTLTIRGKNGLTINGNGATFKQTALPGAPLLQLFSNTNLAINNLTLDGATTHDAAGGEINYGITFESDDGVSLTSDTIENTGGDWVYLEPPYDTKNLPNTNITFNQDKFLNAGYHGFTFESVGCWTTAPCNGLTIENSTMTNIQVDAMDAEVDLASTDFINGVSIDYAENYITIENNTWTNWNGSDWFVSLQGQTPGVQEQHVTLTGNTLNDNAPPLEVDGTRLDLTTPQHMNVTLTVTNNHYGPGYTVKPYRGGTSPAISLQNIVGLTMIGNTFPWCPGVNFPACNASPPAEYEMGNSGILYGNIKSNDFYGAIDLQDPSWGTIARAYYGVHFCGNTYGAGGSQMDGVC